MKHLETLACRFLIWRFKRGYGAECETYDLDDFDTIEPPYKEWVMKGARCPSCRAEETIQFLENHINLHENPFS